MSTPTLPPNSPAHFSSNSSSLNSSMNEKKIKYQNPYYIYPPDNHSDLPTKNRPVLLSDEFAKAAMQGLMLDFHPDGELNIKDIARIAYEMADEMLKARHQYMQEVRARNRDTNDQERNAYSPTNR